MSKNENASIESFCELDVRMKHFSEIVVRLYATNGHGEIIVSGTAFVLAPYLLVTARHVAEHFISAANKIDKNGVEIDLFAVQVRFNVDTHEYVVWRVSHCFHSPITDISIFKLVPYNVESGDFSEWKTVLTTMKPPNAGTKVTAFGLREINTEGSMFRNDGSVEHVSLNAKPTSSSGTVIQHFPSGRDSALMNFPVFAVAARFDHGMSGGFVTDQSGKLCGIVCAGTTDKDDPNSISWVVPLWPACGIVLDFSTFKTSPITGLQPLYSLVAAGVWKPQDIERVSLSKIEGANAYSVKFDYSGITMGDGLVQR